MSANKKNNIETISAGLLGLMMIIFGLNKFIGFIAVAPPADPIAQQFMGAMFSSYLYIIVAIVEIVAGLLLFIPRFRFVGWLLQGIIIFNIAAFHIAHDFIGNGIWILPTMLFLLIGIFQTDKLANLLGAGKKQGHPELKSTVVTTVLLIFCSFNLSAQNNFQSSKVENNITINHSPQAVWALISNFENLPKLVPEVVERVEMNGEGVYASWIIYLQNAQLIKEEMTYYNPEEMELAYVMSKTGIPLSDYLAIQKVERLNDRQSKVTFTTYFNASPDSQEKISTQFDNFQKTFLNNIKSNL